MLEAHHFTAAAKRKGAYALPEEFDGRVNEAALYHAVRAFLNNQRQGTHSTKTKAEVSGGNQKPWRQKGTGRARQGSIRAPQWRGGGVVFGPKPRSYRTGLPRKVKRLARQSALNARANAGQIAVIEALDFEGPKTRRMAELLAGLGLDGRKVLILTTESRRDVYLSSRNLPGVQVMRYADASAYDVLWADVLLVEERAIGGHAIAGGARTTSRARRAQKATAPGGAKRAGRAVAKQRSSATKKKKKPVKRAAAKTTKTKKKGGGDA